MKVNQSAVNELLSTNNEPSIDGIIIIDCKGTVLAFDSAAQNLFGYGEVELLGKPLDILMSDSQAKAHGGFLSSASQKTSNNKTQKLHMSQTIIGKHKDGGLIPLAITVSADHSSKALRFTGVIQDLRKHEETLTKLFQTFHSTTQKLDQRIEFEGLLNTYGNLLLSCPADKFHTIMEAALQAIGQFLSLDHCYILQLSENFTKGSLWAEWRRSASLMKAFPSDFNIHNSKVFLQAIENQDTIVIEQGTETNEVLFNLAQQLSPNGFYSTHITPILDDNKVILGIIGFSTLDPSHPKPDAQLELLSLAIPLIINAWERHQLIIQARHTENNIQEKNKLLAEKAEYSQTLLGASNFLYSSSHDDIQIKVQEVLSEATLISGHREAFIYFNEDKSSEFNSFIQQYFTTDLQKHPHLIALAKKHLFHQEIIQINDLSNLELPIEVRNELEKYDIQSLTAIKLTNGQKNIGCIIFYDALPIQIFSEESLRFLQLTAQNLTAAIQHHAIQFDLEVSQQNLSNANRMLSQQAMHDALTGLANRRAFDNSMAQEFDRATRHKSNLTLLICDIDYFKFYNDHFGHPQGDACLQQVAQVMQRTFNRAGEICTRYGGEEFAIILPAIHHDEAEYQAQRLIDNLQQCKIEHAPQVSFDFVSLSIGIAHLTPEHTYNTIAAMIDDADKALYKAKNNGRNQLAWAIKAE